MDGKLASLRRLMLVADVRVLQASLAAAFNAGKDIQQALNVRVKGLSPPALACEFAAVLSGLIGTLLSGVERADEHHPAELFLVVRVSSLLTPCSNET